MGVRNAGLVLLAAALACKPKAQSIAPPQQPAKQTPVANTAAPSTPAAPTTPAAAAAVPTTKITLAEAGLEAAALDRTADPCVDLYQFACGGWLQANQIPADRARWNRFFEIDEKIKAAIRGLLEEDAKGIGADATAKKLGDYYASCMDEAAVEKAGIGPLKSLLGKTTNVNNPTAWLAALAELHKIGVWVVFRASAQPDLKASSTNVTWLDASGLGLPDRDYYAKPEHKEKLELYKQHVGRMLKLAGVAKPEAAANDVVAIESELAKLMKSAADQRDVQASYNPTDLKALAKRTKSIDWKAYFKAFGVTPSPKLVVGTPKYFAALDGLRKRMKPAQWSSYFTYHLVVRSTLALPKAFDDEAFALQKAVSGVIEKPARYKRCIDATTSALGELLGRQYVDKYFPGSSRQTTATLVDAIVTVMNDELGKLDWMSEPTRKAARAKLAKTVRMIGYPDKWRTYDFEVKRDDFAGNQLRASASETKRVLNKSGKPADRGDWFVNTFDVGAYYNQAANNAVLPAGILQRPFFGPDRSVAANLGGIAMSIGHELTHALDDQGGQFDDSGKLASWWTKEDRSNYEAKTKCVAQMYDSFEALPKQFVNGQLTLRENVADLGGVKMAFRAYRSLRKDAPRVFVADGLTEDQQFFVGVAQAWCNKDRKEELQRRLSTDEHAPPKFRVYGALRNLEEFSQAFSCAAGTPMRPAQTCSVW